jgi:stress-induced morphogen
MLEPDAVKSLLTRAFPEAEIDLVDLTGTRDHYQARIVSAAFVGKSLIEQHQLVYAALGDAMHGPIHALALKTYTPEAWQKLTPKNGS